MNNFLDKLDHVLSPVADVLSNNKFLRSIANGLIALMPLTMVAAIFSILEALPKVASFLPQWSEAVDAALLVPYNVIFGLMALIVSFTVAYQHSKNYEDSDSMMNGLLSLLCFVLMASTYENMTFSAQYFGYAGIFAAVLTALLSVELYHFLVKHNLRIKMPDSVPPLVSKSFEALIPLLILVTVFYGGNCLVVSLTGNSIPALIQSLVTPAIKGSDSIWYQAILHFLMQLFFWLGMHGWAITAGFSMPISNALLAEQSAAYAAGTPIAELPYFTTGGVNMCNVFYFIPLILMFACKAKRNKAIGKMTFIPTLFNISEPMTFGIPIVLNPILGIPFILYQPIIVSINMAAVKYGFMNRSAMSGIAALPQPFSTFVACYGDFRVFLVFAVMMIVAIAIWYPFLMVWDRKCLREEQEAIAAGQVETAE